MKTGKKGGLFAQRFLPNMPTLGRHTVVYTPTYTHREAYRVVYTYKHTQGGIQGGIYPSNTPREAYMEVIPF